MKCLNSDQTEYYFHENNKPEKENNLKFKKIFLDFDLNTTWTALSTLMSVNKDWPKLSACLSNRQTERQTDGETDKQIDSRTAGQAEGRMNGRTGRQTDSKIDRQKDKQMDGWKRRRQDGWIDIQMHRQADKQKRHRESQREKQIVWQMGKEGYRNTERQIGSQRERETDR
jgi:hypothetical protein